MIKRRESEWLAKRIVFSRHDFEGSSLKAINSYKLCYSVDKKAHMIEKNNGKRIAEMKQMLTFVDEKKRSIKLVIGLEGIFDSDRIE